MAPNTAWAQLLAGTWQGSIELEPPLAIGVTLVGPPGSTPGNTSGGGADGLGGTIDIPAQGIADLPLTDVTFSEGRLTFAAVLFITGSGSQDSDETITGHKPFLLLADTLTRANYATLRVDDRGIGGSSGDLSGATCDDLTGDVVASVAFLGAHPAIDRGRIGLFGHSEGGYLAPLAAGRSDDVTFVDMAFFDVTFAIMMAGPAVSGEAVLLLQNRLIFEQPGLPEPQVEAQVAYIRQLSTLLERKDYRAARVLSRKRIAAQYAGLPESQRPSPAEQEAATEAQIMNSLTPNFRAFVTYDPRPALEALAVPVLRLLRRQRRSGAASPERPRAARPPLRQRRRHRARFPHPQPPHAARDDRRARGGRARSRRRSPPPCSGCRQVG